MIKFMKKIWYILETYDILEKINRNRRKSYGRENSKTIYNVETF